MTFHNKDENIYFIGTEEGAIHRCSKSYKEQYLDSFYGHTGAIYKVRLISYEVTPSAQMCYYRPHLTGPVRSGTQKRKNPNWS